jgi:hypothetical protein
MNYLNNVFSFHNIKENTIKLTGAILRKDYILGEYSLDLTYVLDSPTMTQELHIPRIAIPLNPNNIKIKADCDCVVGAPVRYYADLGFGEMKLLPDKNGAAFTITTIEEKPKEMTLDEIEKKLGYKVKIVSK